MSASQEKSIFFDAIEIESEADRLHFLRDACGDNPELLASVQALLREHFRSESPVDRPVLVDLENTADFPGNDSSSFVYTPGTTIGVYKLREQIGEGGFGLVFVADQEKPFRRRVALKIIKPGMDSPEVIARFEAERQALALMDHANIARVYDAGMTHHGHPYFVMELVRGVQLISFCDRHKLSTTDRLELFVSICQAVQYAHQKGIIHRDLKPSNVLITLENGKPIPKVIDFGVAKAINQTLTDRTIYTRFASMIGTPAYMSPEQAEMSNLDVDTRSDIYSLGVLLYEMLTGSTPLVQDRVAKVGFDELRRIIREEEPPRPSLRLSTLSNEIVTTVSANRSLEPARLLSTVQGDLDWIVMKALDKDRNRRYATASALADDVTRYLNQEPVDARPPSTMYRFSRFARKHKLAIVTTSIVSLSVLFGLAISIWQASVATIALRKAQISESIANDAKNELELFTERLKQANNLLTSGYAHVDARNWAEAHAAFTMATQLQPRYYPVWIGRGSLYAKLGLWDQAAADYQRALELGSPIDRAEFLGVSQLFFYTQNQTAYQSLHAQLSVTSIGDLSSGAIARGLLIDQTVSTSVAQQIADIAEQRIAECTANTDENEPLRRRERSGMPLGARLYIAGWAHYRVGNYKQAVLRLQEANEDRRTWSGHGTAYPLLAMTYYKMGKTDEAKATLEKSREQLSTWLHDSLDGPDVAIPIPWFDWIEFLIEYERAELRINGKLPPGNPMQAKRTARALSAVE